jgi:type IV secretory pathway TrbD component
MHGTPVIYFKSLNRPFTVLGVDRSLFYLFVGIGLAIAFSARLALVMDVVAGVVFVVLHAMGVLLTRVDANVLAVYRRHIHYHSYYAAQPTIGSFVPLIKPSVPVYQGQRGWV